MGLRSTLIKPYAKKLARQIEQEMSLAEIYQEKIFHYLINSAKNTRFGKDHDFENIKSHRDFVQKVPLRSYDQLEPYIQKIFEGEKDVLWPRKPLYFVGTSGTTSGIKYIPLTKESMPYHLKTARNAVINYAYKENILKIFDSKMLFLSGSPQLGLHHGFKTGRLSGIVNHVIPQWLKWNKLPTEKTNSIEDWEQKVLRIVEDTRHQKMSMLSGITPWILMYLEYLLQQTGANNASELFPELKLLVHGGVNYLPYKNRMDQLLGGNIHSFETYPSTEGFVAFQEGNIEQGLALNANGGVFFEFVKAEEIHNENPDRIPLKAIEVGQNYAIIINNNAGLWGSKLGDTVRFVSKNPYRLVFTGRTEHFLSAFGEHIISREVETALERTLQQSDAAVTEFTVAPQVSTEDQLPPYHEWFIEFSKPPSDLKQFMKNLDQNLQSLNFHYKELVQGQIIRPLCLNIVEESAFRRMAKHRGKLGGQNKPIRLANNRKIAELLEPFSLEKHHF